MNHEIDTHNYNFRTDLLLDEINNSNKDYIVYEDYDNINVSTIIVNDDNKNKFYKKNGKYITIEFNDVTDYNNSKKLKEVLIKKIEEIIIDNNIKQGDTCLVIGLGNKYFTADSLGPLSIENIIVTNHFYSLGIDVEEGFRSVAAISPGVTGQTGIETFDIINSLVKELKPDFLLVIDSLKASKIDRLNKTIQITDSGISPGSGIGNNRKEISKELLNIPVIAIGVPTVVDTLTIVNDSFNYMVNYYSYMKNNINNPSEKLKIIRTNFSVENMNDNDRKQLFGLIGTLDEEELKLFINETLFHTNYNMIVSVKDIDLQIKKLSDVISTSINNALHKNVNDL